MGRQGAGRRREPQGVERDPGAVNVAPLERVLSGLAGVGMALAGLRRAGTAGLALVALGGALVHRGLTGRCRVYRALGMGTAGPTRSPVASVPHEQGVKVEKSVTVARPPSDLYRFWRDVENLPRVMTHLRSVRTTGEGRSRWVARGPLGRSVEWEAEVINERPNELIAWRSLPGSDIHNAGSVQFRSEAGGRGTELKVVLEYRPPAGRVGAALARLLGEDPETQVAEDLRRFKQIMEAGEAATVERPVAAAPERRLDSAEEASQESSPASDPPAWPGGPGVAT